MSSKLYHRDISKSLQLLRTLLLGRSWNDQLRFQDQLSPRPYPKPNLICGSAHKSSDNHYTFRDPRRSVQPPEDLNPKMIADSTTNTNKNLPPAPGKAYQWDVY